MWEAASIVGAAGLSTVNASGGTNLPKLGGAAPVQGLGDKIEEGRYDSAGLIKSPTQKEWKDRNEGSWGLNVKLLGLKDSDWAWHCERCVYPACAQILPSRALQSTGQ